MGLLSAASETTFVVYEGEPLYAEADLDRICKRHDVPAGKRGVLKRMLEEAGRVYVDQMQLNGRPSQTIRLRQDLRKGLCLLSELTELVPDVSQPRQDMGPSDAAHAAALREGDRQVQAADKLVAPGLLADAQSHLAYLRDVYEAALESAARGARGAPERQRTIARWRSPVIEFYTRELGRTWLDTGTEHEGERFVRDCQHVLDEGGDAEAGASVVKHAAE